MFKTSAPLTTPGLIPLKYPRLAATPNCHQAVVVRIISSYAPLTRRIYHLAKRWKLSPASNGDPSSLMKRYWCMWGICNMLTNYASSGITSKGHSRHFRYGKPFAFGAPNTTRCDGACLASMTCRIATMKATSSRHPSVVVFDQARKVRPARYRSFVGAISTQTMPH